MGAGVCAVALAWLAALSVYDIRERRLPNWLTLPGAAAAIAVACWAHRGPPAVIGAAALAALYLVVHLVVPTAMGAGDVKLALGLGAVTGYFGVDVWLLAAVTAPLLTVAWALITFATSGERTVPHGPAMCFSTAAAAALALLP
jgi:leader peptidase (prepilin peptidase)/N-methyltransferase